MSKDALKEKIHQGVSSYPKRNYIKKVALFGSRVRGDEKAGSDVDLLVSFDPDAPVGFFEFVRFQQFLESELGQKVDLVTEESLSPFFRDAVLRQAETVYGN